MRALVVDDAPEIRELIGLLLSGGGFTVEDPAESAEEAFIRLKLEEPAAPPTADIILLDVMLPGIDGIAACARIKRDPRYRDVPVLMVTARQESASLQEAFAAGAADYIRKPVQKSELLARARSAVRLKMEWERREQASIRPDAAAAHCIHPRLLLPTRALVEAIIETAAAAECQPPMALAAIEIDGYAAHCTAAGDDAGDALAVAVGGLLAREAGCLGDVLAHGGHGTFLLLLRRVQSPDAEARVARCIRAVADAAAGQDAGGQGAGGHGATISAGVAWCPADTPATLRELPSLALRALASASNAGGNRAEVA